MLNKAIDILNLASGLIMAFAAIAFAICVQFEYVSAVSICGITLMLVGGMYIATSILSIVNKYFTKN